MATEIREGILSPEGNLIMMWDDSGIVSNYSLLIVEMEQQSSPPNLDISTLTVSPQLRNGFLPLILFLTTTVTLGIPSLPADFFCRCHVHVQVRSGDPVLYTRDEEEEFIYFGDSRVVFGESRLESVRGTFGLFGELRVETRA
jgi:hypothetical protein